jgi:hypothetical protein
VFAGGGEVGTEGLQLLRVCGSGQVSVPWVDEAKKTTVDLVEGVEKRTQMLVKCWTDAKFT